MKNSSLFVCAVLLSVGSLTLPGNANAIDVDVEDRGVDQTHMIDYGSGPVAQGRYGNYTDARLSLHGRDVLVSVDGTNACRGCGDHRYWGVVSVFDASGAVIWRRRTEYLLVGGDLGHNGWARGWFRTTLPADIAERAATASILGFNTDNLSDTYSPPEVIPMQRRCVDACY